MSSRLLIVEGVTPELAGALEACGYTTVESLAIASPQELVERVRLKGFNEEYARQIIASARASFKPEFITADKLPEKVKRLTTGSKALDKLIGGGVETRAITEVAGAFGSGKTQLCFTLSVNAVRDWKSGVLFMDTESTFQKARLREICEALGLDPNKILGEVSYCEVYNSSHLLLMLEAANRIIKERSIKLLIIDSLIAPFRSEYCGRELLWFRQQKLNGCLRRLINYAKVYNLAVVVTNQVVSTPQVYYGVHFDAPTGGNIMAHAGTLRLYLRKGQGGRRIARIIDSSWLPENECVFMIGRRGVCDVE